MQIYWIIMVWILNMSRNLLKPLSKVKLSFIFLFLKKFLEYDIVKGEFKEDVEHGYEEDTRL